MRSVIGSVAPLMPMTGYFNSRNEELSWKEGNLSHWNAYFTLRGSGEISFPRKSVETTVGEFLLLPPGIHRSYKIRDPKEGWEFYWLHFRATPRLVQALDWFNAKIAWQVHRIPEVHQRLRIAEGLEAMHRLNLSNPDLKEREPMIEASLEALILQIALAEKSLVPSLSIDTRIEKALEFFHCDIASRTGVTRLSRVAGLSRSQFCQLFRKGTGRSPQQYIEERRLEMAAFYLRSTALTVTEASQMVGFTNPFYFTLRFKRRFGKNPSLYRRK